MVPRPSRRELVRAIGVGATSALGGCVTFGGDEPSCTHETVDMAAIDAVADGAWPTWGYDPANTAANPGAASPDLDSTEIAWSSALPAVPAARPLVAHGNVYAHTEERVIAFDVAGGDRQWSLSGSDGPRILGLALADGAAYVGRFRPLDDEGDHLLAVDAATGNRRWRSATESPPARITATDQEVVVGTVGASATTDGWVHSFDPSDGSERWRTELDGNVRTQPAVTKDVVIVGTGDQRLFALDRSNGAPCWQVDLVGHPWRLAVSNGHVYVGTITPGENWRRLSVQNGTDGTLRWRTDDLREKPTRLIDRIAVIDGVALLSNREKVYALADDGSTNWVWERPAGDVDGWQTQALAVAGDHVVTDAPGSLRTIALDSGEAVGSLGLDASVTELSVAGESLFVCVDGNEGEGRVLALR